MGSQNAGGRKSHPLWLVPVCPACSYKQWECEKDDFIPTLEAVFEALPLEIGFDIEVRSGARGTAARHQGVTEGQAGTG